MSVYVCLCFFLWCFSGTLIGLKLIMWLASQLGQPQGSDLPLLFYCFHLFNQSDKTLSTSWGELGQLQWSDLPLLFQSFHVFQENDKNLSTSWAKLGQAQKAPMAWFGLAYSFYSWFSYYIFSNNWFSNNWFSDNWFCDNWFSTKQFDQLFFNFLKQNSSALSNKKL